MIAHSRVVAGVSPTDLRPEVVLWAADEAAARGARLVLVSVWPGPSTVDQPPRSVRTALRWAESLATDRRPGLPIEPHAVHGRPEHKLVVESTGADLLVIGADVHSPFVEAITGSVPGALLTTAPCPVVVVPKGAEPPTGLAPVVVGVDTETSSHAAIGYAFAAAGRSHRPLEAVLCGPARDRADRRAVRESALATVLAEAGGPCPDVAVTELVVDGDPIDVLTRRSSKAALLVLGSHGRGRLASMAFGSVSRTLIRNSRCPVAVLRPHAVVANRVAS